MNVSLGICTTVTSPVLRGDNPQGALDCYLDLADEVVVVDGTPPHSPDFGWFEELGYNKAPKLKRVLYEWPQEFPWTHIGEQFTRAYDACTTDWVIRADADMVWHENDFAAIRRACERYPDAPALSFWKWQLIQPTRYNLKSRLVILANKGKYGDRLKFNAGGDLAQLSLDGVYLRPDDVPEAKIPFYNFEKLCKTKEQVADDVGRMDRAWHRLHGKYLYGKDGSDESAFEGWLKMVSGRYTKPQQELVLTDHPKYVQETIRNLTPEQFGHSGWGML